MSDASSTGPASDSPNLNVNQVNQSPQLPVITQGSAVDATPYEGDFIVDTALKFLQVMKVNVENPDGVKEKKKFFTEDLKFKVPGDMRTEIKLDSLNAYFDYGGRIFEALGGVDEADRKMDCMGITALTVFKLANLVNSVYEGHRNLTVRISVGWVGLAPSDGHVFTIVNQGTADERIIDLWSALQKTNKNSREVMQNAVVKNNTTELRKLFSDKTYTKLDTCGGIGLVGPGKGILRVPGLDKRSGEGQPVPRASRFHDIPTRKTLPTSSSNSGAPLPSSSSGARQ